MSNLYRKYIPYKDRELEFDIHFNKQLTNWATGRSQKIGYYITITPVKRSRQDGLLIKEFGAFTGFKDLLLEVDRQSKKRLEEAIRIAESRSEEYINWFEDKKLEL